MFICIEWAPIGIHIQQQLRTVHIIFCAAFNLYLIYRVNRLSITFYLHAYTFRIILNSSFYYYWECFLQIYNINCVDPFSFDSRIFNILFFDRYIVVATEIWNRCELNAARIMRRITGNSCKIVNFCLSIEGRIEFGTCEHSNWC